MNTKHKRVLLSGFIPFGKLDYNPTEKLLDYFKDDTQVSICLLPVSYEKSFLKLKEVLVSSNFDYVIMTGVAKERSKLSFEQLAVNYNYSFLKDNDGVNSSKASNIIINGELSFKSTLPISKLMELDIESEISFSAGTYVCNNVFYKTMSFLKKKNLSTCGGFIHVPLDWEQNKINTSLKLIIDKLIN